MKINKTLRNLLIRQPETLMFSKTSCNYFGSKYTFTEVTSDEILQISDNILKLLDERSWAKKTMDRLFGGNK